MWTEHMREQGESMLRRMQGWLYKEERSFAAVCFTTDRLSFFAFRKREGWELFNHHTTSLDAYIEDNEKLRAVAEKSQQVLGRWGMVGEPLVLVLSEDRVSYSYYKLFPSMERDALEVAVQWDAAAESGLSNTDSVVAYQEEKDGRICIAVLDRDALASYKQVFLEAGISLRDIIFVDQTEDLLVSERELQYRSVSCLVAVPISAWTDGMRLALVGAMQWQTGTAVSFLSRQQTPKVFRWQRLAAILLILSAGVFFILLLITSLQIQERRADLAETDNRLRLLAEEIEQRDIHEQVKEKIRKKNHQLVVLSNYRAPYRGLLIRLGAMETKGVGLEEVRFDAEGMSSIKGHAASYEVLSEYMNSLTSEDVSPLVHANLQQAEQNKDTQGIDFIIALHLPQEVASDEK